MFLFLKVRYSALQECSLARHEDEPLRFLPRLDAIAINAGQRLGARIPCGRHDDVPEVVWLDAHGFCALSDVAIEFWFEDFMNEIASVESYEDMLDIICWVHHVSPSFVGNKLR